MLAHFVRISAILALVMALGCVDSGEHDDTEYVVLDYTDVGLDDTNGPGAVDPGEQPDDPCACGDDYQCLSDWAEESFRCGVCATITCPERNLDVCTDFCGIETTSLAGGDMSMEAER